MSGRYKNGRNKNGRYGSERSRPALFLMEQLIVITVFAVCAAVCVKIFAASFLMANGARDANIALAAAKSAAECYKVYGDPVKTAAVLSGRASLPAGKNRGVVYYDAEWRASAEPDAAYVLYLEAAPDAGDALPLLCELSVAKITGEKILNFTVAARQKQPQRRAGNE